MIHLLDRQESSSTIHALMRMIEKIIRVDLIPALTEYPDYLINWRITSPSVTKTHLEYIVQNKKDSHWVGEIEMRFQIITKLNQIQ